MNADYRVARQAQDAAYETATGLPVGETNRQEYRDYFGVGDYAGTPVAQRVTPKEWMIAHRSEQQPDSVVTEAQAFLMSGADLASLAAEGDYVAGAEIVRRAVRRAQRRGVAA